MIEFGVRLHRLEDVLHYDGGGVVEAFKTLVILAPVVRVDQCTRVCVAATGARVERFLVSGEHV
eukprot:CAMPEP_0116995168 /NCGR_PEP_ID=MMETSP0467-20121206/68586_1 /TAXON_ID=283647 /ORGANISM="Mesodinium pulex, Strain SPMC105" /LENGTH=63 /DNA_ID=CAMNT_0004693417 /DNA_START=587 /DNA_END=775 /DNA_ORIENTATION=+